ncbi:MAG: serine/threonine-protein kinase [Polyangiaceae bacterium]
MAAKTPSAGLVLAERYRLEEKLGEGGMGTVWRAEHLVLCAPVAVKVLDRDVSQDEEAHDRFIREARSAAALRSPHVVQILDYGVDDGFPYIAMELLEGETLQRRLARSGTLSPLETARIITHVARAVGRAHEAGIIHRDLKPENVFIVKNEDAEVCKVLDFGVAKVETAQLGPKGTRTRTGSLLGTPFYMSPEQAQGNKTIDQRSDLWSLGVIAYECLTGKRPFESDGLGDLVLQICVRDMPVPSQLAPVPAKFDDWFAHACSREPEKRFQTARELSDALREVVGIEARETLATLPEEELPSVPKSVVVRSGRDDDSNGTAKTIVEAPKDVDDADAVVEGKKPSLTIRQFGTTQSSSPASSSRTALLVGVGGLALAVGIVAGFLVLGGPNALGAGDAPTATPENDAQANTAPPPSASAEPVKKRDKEREDAAVSADAAEEASIREAQDASAEGGSKSASVDDKTDKKDKPPVDASTDRDWGKTDPETPPPEENKLPPPPPPVGGDG